MTSECESCAVTKGVRDLNLGTYSGPVEGWIGVGARVRGPKVGQRGRPVPEASADPLCALGETTVPVSATLAVSRS